MGTAVELMYRGTKSWDFSGCSPALEANKDIAGSPSGTDQT